ncbi:MAG: A/G-specific adenine glycosylase [Actinobacteria bacterium]|uniref:Adenine DNA glycosylase n=1 Tax=freshwater metagenome TaxID=449393 RepID=A0A6J7QEQ7_9ZZZZ|nr:A/G-specific adenine glycosylase [Actinomycetota bacterium]
MRSSRVRLCCVRSSGGARELVDPVLDWYRVHRRDLPWRAASTTPWQVLVSEVMLAQTPVSRVTPVYREWLQRWPDAASLAAASPAEVIRAWGRLGYPRRALRLHQTAMVVDREHGGQPPCDLAALRALPGVGEYTAAAVLAFAYEQRIAVLDTNVRRVLARVLDGTERAPASMTNPERARAAALLPTDATRAARWSVAVMELGALVCFATGPRCETCPVSAGCAWRALGHPAAAVPPRRQAWHGTDRQCRGQLMAQLRASHEPVSGATLRDLWGDDAQRERCLDSLIDDRLVDIVSDDLYSLPS